MTAYCKCGYSGEELLLRQTTFDKVEVTGIDGKELTFNEIETGDCDPFPPLVCPDCMEDFDEAYSIKKGTEV